MLRPKWPPSALLLLALVSTSCDHSPQGVMASPEPVPMRLTVPEAEYHLTAEQRARVGGAYDADALERLMGMIRPDMRAEVLKSFLRPEHGERPGMLVKFTDPELQAVLEEVWVPYWDEVSDEDLNGGNDVLPGRRLAQERRAARRQTKAERPNGGAHQ